MAGTKPGHDDVEMFRDKTIPAVKSRWSDFAIPQAVLFTVSPSSRIISSRIKNFCTLPVTVIGKASTKRM